MSELHPDLEKLPYFRNIPPNDLEQNVGKDCYFIAPRAPAFRRTKRYKIVAVQWNYKRELVYRVEEENDKHHFGTCADPNEIRILKRSRRPRKNG